MKKIFAIILILLVFGALILTAGCKKADEPAQKPAQAVAPAPEQKPAEKPVAEPEKKPAEKPVAAPVEKKQKPEEIALVPKQKEAVVKKEAPKVTETRAIIETKFGNIELKFFPDVAPNHVKNFIELAKKGFYDGTIFHRVIPGFMIQGGDPNSKSPDKAKHGIGGPGYKIKAEFNIKPHKRGILSMARTADPDSAGSQFFICVKDAPSLDGQYTVFGEVVSGMDVVDKIVSQPRDRRDNPDERIEIKVRIIEQAMKKDTPKAAIPPTADTTASAVLVNTDIRKLNVSNYKGRAVMLMFTASWCPPCRKIAPDIQNIYVKYKQKGLSVIAISAAIRQKEEISDITSFAQQSGLTYPVFIDDGSFTKQYGIIVVPSLILIGKDGLVKTKREGAVVDMNALGKEIESLL